MGNRKGSYYRKHGARYYVVRALILWGGLIVSLLILKYAADGSKFLYITLGCSPFLVFLYIFFWALDLRRPQGIWHARPSLGIFGLVVLYVMLVVLFMPAYMASIRLGDQIVTKDNTCIRDTEYGKLAYFGLVTASTLGYGDIVPRIDSGRTQLLVCVQVIEFWMFFIIAFVTVEHWIKPEREPA